MESLTIARRRKETGELVFRNTLRLDLFDVYN